MSQTLADWLGRRYPTAKKQNLRRMVGDGRVRVTNAVATRFNQPLAEADAVAVDEGPRERPPAAPSRAGPDGRGVRLPPVDVLYEDDDLLVAIKPAGLLTSTTPREPRPTLLAAVKAHVANRDRRTRVGLIHRLDRDASGLLVFSKSDAAYHDLKTQFFHHHVERVYLAVVHGVPPAQKGKIESRLDERADGTVFTTRQIGKGQPAVTDYEVIRTAGRRSLVKLTLQTGRKHQIRAHLQERGTPIVGDAMYGPQVEAGRGKGKADDGPRPPLMLAAVRLAITHPRTQERKVFEIPVPRAFEEMVPAQGVKP